MNRLFAILIVIFLHFGAKNQIIFETAVEYCDENICTKYCRMWVFTN